MQFKRILFILLSTCLLTTTAHAQSMQHEKHYSVSASEKPAAPTMPETHSMSSMMHGALGKYVMTREASGTSWQPDSTPLGGLHIMKDNWMFMVHGFADLIYDHQGGPRGATQKFFSTNMLMLMGQRDLGPGTFSFQGMFSAEPAMGAGGYPLLLQTGETANGHTPLIDRQHPHDALMELAATYSIPISEKSSVYTYIGYPGEPAIGPPAFMHRWSGENIPEAPIAHHWLDSTHISYGVFTLGYIWQNWKLEGSLFNGQEPDQYRWNMDSARLNSRSIRLTFNPSENWSLQTSFAHIISPEQLEPETNTNRTTVSAIYNLPLAHESNWQTTVAWGQNSNQPGHRLNAYLLESTVNFFQKHTFFGRAERVQEDELLVAPNPYVGEVFTVNRLTVGYIREFSIWHHFKPGIGASMSTYALPSVLQQYYGSRPFSYMLFARVKID